MLNINATGIVAEYNPFHSGHKYQIEFLKKQGAETIAVALSGNFVQRGTPAWCDKYLRTQMALSQGADFVFELPVLYALSSAEGFAFGGVSLLNALPLDSLCFGTETGDLSDLQAIADFLSQQDMPAQNKASHDTPSDAKTNTTTAYREKLRSFCSSGMSFPAAREKALALFLPEIFDRQADILSQPNQILALEYIKALKKTDSQLHPIALKRIGGDYHDTALPSDADPIPPVSADAIRHYFAHHGALPTMQGVLPDFVLSLLEDNLGLYPLDYNDFSLLIYHALRAVSCWEDYMKYGAISGELARRINNMLPQYENIESFLQQLKTKNITYSSISRSILHILLGITTQQLDGTKNPVPYLRILGMRRDKSSFLRRVDSLPIITKTADYRKILSEFYGEGQQREFAIQCFEKDVLAADLYRQVLHHKTGQWTADEYHHSIVIA